MKKEVRIGGIERILYLVEGNGRLTDLAEFFAHEMFISQVFLAAYEEDGYVWAEMPHFVGPLASPFFVSHFCLERFYGRE